MLILLYIGQASVRIHFHFEQFNITSEPRMILPPQKLPVTHDQPTLWSSNLTCMLSRWGGGFLIFMGAPFPDFYGCAILGFDTPSILQHPHIGIENSTLL